MQIQCGHAAEHIKLLDQGAWLCPTCGQIADTMQNFIDHLTRVRKEYFTPGARPKIINLTPRQLRAMDVRDLEVIDRELVELNAWERWLKGHYSTIA